MSAPVIVTYNGKQQRLMDLAAEHGLEVGTILRRWTIAGRPSEIDAAILRPVTQPHIKACEICGATFQAPPTGPKVCSKQCNSVKLSRRVKRHGESGTRLHNIWSHMCTRTRCRNRPLVRKYYKHVTLCDEWKVYENFRDWALAAGYRDDLEIDRIDVMGGYSPENCRWATRCQQMANTRRSTPNATSKYRGVSWCANVNKWRAQIQHNRTHKHLGVFTTQEEAYEAYLKAAQELVGDFMVTSVKEDCDALLKQDR